MGPDSSECLYTCAVGSLSESTLGICWCLKSIIWLGASTMCVYPCVFVHFSGSFSAYPYMLLCDFYMPLIFPTSPPHLPSSLNFCAGKSVSWLLFCSPQVQAFPLVCVFFFKRIPSFLHSFFSNPFSLHSAQKSRGASQKSTSQESQSLWHGGGDSEVEGKAAVLVIPPSRIRLHGL